MDEQTLKLSFPLDKIDIINRYYALTAKKNSIKYFGDKWDNIWNQKWSVVQDLGLLDTQRKSILDIGAGPHIFAWMAKQLGHKIMTTELPVDNNTGIEAQNILYFHDIKSALGIGKQSSVPRLDWEITLDTVKLPAVINPKKRFDFITTQRSNFNIGWECDQYHNFVKCCMGRLKLQGKLHWQITKNDRPALLQYLDKHTDVYIYTENNVAHLNGVIGGMYSVVIQHKGHIK
jgi:hypothetical protein